jgi:ATP-dependent Clp protease ATP-binding subunit ClpC
MFERFTDRARRVVVLSQEEARNLGHSAIETEHLLLGVAAEAEGVGARALANCGFSADFIRDRINERRDPSETSLIVGHMPFTPEAKKTFEGSLREALQLGHNYIGTEHILLGLLRSESLACEILTEKVELKAIRAEVLRILASYQSARPTTEPILTQEEARQALLHRREAHSVVESIVVCTAELDLLEGARERAAVLAFLAAWYSHA